MVVMRLKDSRKPPFCTAQGGIKGLPYVQMLTSARWYDEADLDVTGFCFHWKSLHLDWRWSDMVLIDLVWRSRCLVSGDSGTGHSISRWQISGSTAWHLRWVSSGSQPEIAGWLSVSFWVGHKGAWRAVAQMLGNVTVAVIRLCGEQPKSKGMQGGGRFITKEEWGHAMRDLL